MPIKSLRALNAFAALVMIVCAFAVLNAQSGRRLPKGSPPVATPTPIPEPATQPKPPRKPDFTLKVYSDIPNGSAFSFLQPERMHRWAVERMKLTPLLDVLDSGSANRRDAIKQAKIETEVYVVLLEMQNDPFVQYGTSSARTTSVVVTVYHPASGKVKFSRTLGMGQNSTRMPGSTTVMQACNPGVYGNDLLLLEGSIEAADSVMNNFNVPLPPLCKGLGL